MVDKNGGCRNHDGSLLGIIGNHVARFDQVIHVKHCGLAKVCQGFFGRMSPGVTTFQGWTKRVVGKLPIFETVLLDYGAKYVGLHDFIMLHGRHRYPSPNRFALARHVRDEPRGQLPCGPRIWPANRKS